jgi:hypothetical protein
LTQETRSYLRIATTFALFIGTTQLKLCRLFHVLEVLQTNGLSSISSIVEHKQNP